MQICADGASLEFGLSAAESPGDEEEVDSARCGSLCEEMTDYIQLSFTTHHTGAQAVLQL